MVFNLSRVAYAVLDHDKQTGVNAAAIGRGRYAVKDLCFILKNRISVWGFLLPQEHTCCRLSLIFTIRVTRDLFNWEKQNGF